MSNPAPDYDESHPPEDPLGEFMVRDAARDFARGRRKRKPSIALLLNRCRRIYRAHRVRALQARVLLNYSEADLRGLIQRALQSGICKFCGRKLNFRTFTVSHKNPPRRGGRHTFSNLMVCCRMCRALKGLLDAQEFRELTLLMNNWPIMVRRHFVARLGIGRPKPKPPHAA